jgi:signal transduction histidine kinase
MNDAETSLGRVEETLRHLQKVDAISQLSGAIAHDFNNSLQNVVASLELARKLISAGRTGETDRFITMAIDAARTAAALNQRVLGLSRRRPLAPKVLRLNELITGMEDLLRRALPRSIKLEVTLPPDLWQTFCDGNEAETALLNLTLNARDAITGDGLIAIEATNVPREPLETASLAKMAQREMTEDQVTQNEVARLAYVCVAVTDSGTGMGRDVAERAFDAFFTTKAPGQGLGLGLTMVDKFARRSGGRATINSEIGGGTCVAFYLPRQDGSPD